MKTLILTTLLLIAALNLKAQTRDLNFYLEQAKVNSPLINKNKNESKIAKLDLAQIRSMLSKPSVNLESSVLFAPIISHDNHSDHFKWISNGADDYTGYDLAVTDGGQYQAFISLKQLLFTNSRLRTYSAKADLSEQINENKTVLTIHELKQLVTCQYILCLQAKMQEENRISLLKEMDEQLQMMRKLVENGIYKQSDFILLQITDQNYQIELKSFQSDYLSNLYDLNLLCGIKDTSKVDLQAIKVQIEPEKITKSNFSVTYQLDSLNLITTQKISEMDYKPQVSLLANAGLNAVYRPSFDRIGFSTGISFSWNIFDGHQRKIQREKSTINLSTLEFEKQNFLNKADMHRNKIIDQIHSLDQQIDLVNGQLKNYEQLLNIYSEELSQGELSVIDFKNLFQDIASKKQEDILLKTKKQILINAYQYWNY